MVLASASDDGKVSFWKRNGTKLMWEAPNDGIGGGTINEVIEIFFLSFVGLENI